MYIIIVLTGLFEYFDDNRGCNRLTMRLSSDMSQVLMTVDNMGNSSGSIYGNENNNHNKS